MFRVHEKESGSQHYQCSSIAVLAFFVVIRTLSLRWKCLEMVRTALEAGLPRPARAHQRLALLAAATRAGVFPLPEALAVAAVGRRIGNQEATLSCLKRRTCSRSRRISVHRRRTKSGLRAALLPRRVWRVRFLHDASDVGPNSAGRSRGAGCVVVMRTSAAWSGTGIGA